MRCQLLGTPPDAINYSADPKRFIVADMTCHGKALLVLPVNEKLLGFAQHFSGVTLGTCTQPVDKLPRQPPVMLVGSEQNEMQQTNLLGVCNATTVQFVNSSISDVRGMDSVIFVSDNSRVEFSEQQHPWLPH